jgi:DNA topoisomerase-6 subunit B
VTGKKKAAKTKTTARSKGKAAVKAGRKVSRPQMDLFDEPSAAKANSPDASGATEPEDASAAIPPPEPAPARKRTAPRANAQTMAQKQREISVSEFFVKNRHLLGFDNPRKALLTAVRECVDNSLDACSEAGILPTLRIHVDQLAEDRYRVSVEDTGPGIVRKQIPRIFGKLLYGSKFHTLKQQRGQQGIGVSAAGMYGQLTTGKPVHIISRTGPRTSAHLFEITVDTKRNEPLVLKDEVTQWDTKRGTRVEIELEATYKKGRRSVDDYVEQTALANPHTEIFYTPPKQEAIHYPRAVTEVPEEPKEIKPHPYGVELGRLMRMLQDTRARNLSAALKSDFSRVSDKVVSALCEVAKLRPNARPRNLSHAEVERLHKAFSQVKIMSPPTNCLSPIGEEAMIAGLQKRFEADYYEAVTRPPAVYRGNPFQVEVGLAYGGSLPGDHLIELYRLANRVPLQYQASACAINKSVLTVDWRSYGMSMSKGALPSGPMVLMSHIASVWVPFTSESKEAIAHYPEIIKELRLALMLAGRKLSSHIRHRRRAEAEAKKKSYIDKFIPHIGIALKDILGFSDREEQKVVDRLKLTLERSREHMK